MDKKKPYVVCYMMSSLDGRIDCAMTEHLPGTDDYYEILNELNLKTTISGRRTAELEIAKGGKFVPQKEESFGKETFSCKAKAEGYDIIVDSKGTLLWDKVEEGDPSPRLIVTSKRVSKEYLAYLDKQNISYIVNGEEHPDLAKTLEVLSENFGVTRLGLVGGPRINTAFLDAGLVDEIDILIGPGIDGRENQESLFEGRKKNATPLLLHLTTIKTNPNGSVLLTYLTK